ncbi:hypothetical protein AVEN_197887-1 [Araneus ventricosus]|uniref:Uncharacterized protein n=1 Tax=Araneus ventricosus TaxID=182803 RepID=A0A4Y2CJ78_ARAVE|nr:hypothetical protein AVEN_197887-1 [Araneus ventricosus]
MFRVVSDTMVLPHLPQFRPYPVLQNQWQTNRWRKLEQYWKMIAVQLPLLMRIFPKQLHLKIFLRRYRHFLAVPIKIEKGEKSVQVRRSKLITPRISKEDLKMKAKIELKSEEEKREGSEETHCISCAETFEEDWIQCRICEG